MRKMHQSPDRQDPLPGFEPPLRPEPGPLRPTREHALARIEAVCPDAYARSRNAIGGAVSGLSPYITHGLVTLSEVLCGVNRRRPLELGHKWVYELGWRAYFRQVWRHRGDAIFQSLHPGPLPDPAYAPALPDDLREARTGVPVVDQAVRTLYATGTLHNHARLWLASYVVHVRKVHWRAGADWLYGHLLDGDLASNHLSWQWVAGTGSHKPYLFNAENVARHAPPAWHSPGSVIDAPYEALDRLARQPAAARPLPPRSAAASPGMAEPDRLAAPPASLRCTAPETGLVAGRDVWLVHPWNLGPQPADLPADAVVIGLWLADFHQAWPWTEQRWQFVGQRMAELTPHRWWAPAQAIGQALRSARRVRTLADPHLARWLPLWAQELPADTLFPEVAPRFASFSSWWAQATRGLSTASDLLTRPECSP